jgi:hypothetical protein
VQFGICKSYHKNQYPFASDVSQPEMAGLITIRHSNMGLWNNVVFDPRGDFPNPGRILEYSQPTIDNSTTIPI